MTINIFENARIGLSQKVDGPIARAGDLEATEAEINNRKKYLESQSINSGKVVSAKITHSNKVFRVNSKDAGKTIQEVDALITNERDLVLSVTVADCFPVYFFEPKRAVGIAHAGWRGIVNGIVTNTLKSLRDNLDCDVKNLKVYVGPGIQKHHFEIQEDVIERFKDYPRFVQRFNGKMHVDLSGIINKQLLDFGLQTDNISISSECTFCERAKYFSFRRDKPKEVQAMLAFISFK